LFDLGKPFALPLHCRPLNVVRKEHGLPSLGHNIRVAYTDADDVLYADLEGLFPMRGVPQREHFLGPILWSPDVALPTWWNEVAADQPIVYVSVGSSGDPLVLRRIVESLAGLPVQLMVSSAGSSTLDGLNLPNVHVAPYLPGDLASARASLVVCNGGSMGCQQALVHGVPVLGVCGNMDQFLNMHALVAAGCAQMVRADRVNAEALRSLVQQMLADSGLRAAAAVQASALRQQDPVANLARWLEQLSPAAPRATH
jgi:UDP:flavonoid glycosyltransferase YjiC (YdhE family)